MKSTKLSKNNKRKVGSEKKTAMPSVDPDDKLIRQMEKRLGIKKKRSISASLKEDGLDFLLRPLSKESNQDDNSSDTDVTDDLEYLRQKRKHAKTLKNLSNSSSDDSVSESDMSSDDEPSQLKNAKKQENGARSNLSSMANQKSTSLSFKKLPHLPKSGIPPSTKDAEGTLAIASCDADILQHAHSSMGVANNSLRRPIFKTKVHAEVFDERQLRKLRGILNRLSETTMEGLFTDFQELYSSSSRQAISQSLGDCILHSLTHQPIHLLDTFVLSYAAFLGLVYHILNSECVMRVLEFVICEFHDWYEKIPSESVSDDSEDNFSEIGRKSRNALLLIVQLYNLQLISCNMIYFIIRQLISRFHVTDVEFLLLIFRHGGFQLRNDDPTSLKQIILLVQERVSLEENPGIRVRFMLDMMNDIKNNKKKEIANDEPLKKMKSFVKSIVQKHKSSMKEPIQVGYNEFLQAEEKGRWWLVGYAWSGKDDANTATSSKFTTNQSENNKIDRKSKQNANILDSLAKEQQLNTGLRKQIFNCMMTSEDYLDAFEKLMKLNLKEESSREIITVLLQCCGQEKIFNPFYAFLGEKLCAQSHGFKITFQYKFWDFFKSLDSDPHDIPIRKLANIAKLLSQLFLSEALPLSLLKSVDFHLVSQMAKVFFQYLFCQTMQHSSEQQVFAVYRSLLVTRKNNDSHLRDNLLFFMQQHLLSNLPSFVKQQQRNIVLHRIAHVCKLYEQAALMSH